MNDLERHMFICGVTGTGKSNFLQYFLLNFSKKYEIPFLITEFKWEYHFLQNEIENLLIIKPGENQRSLLGSERQFYYLVYLVHLRFF